MLTQTLVLNRELYATIITQILLSSTFTLFGVIRLVVTAYRLCDRLPVK